MEVQHIKDPATTAPPGASLCPASSAAPSPNLSLFPTPSFLSRANITHAFLPSKCSVARPQSLSPHTGFPGARGAARADSTRGVKRRN